MDVLKKGLTSYQLKIIGIILMVLDHIHQMFYFVGAPIQLTMVGRLVAPIFLFLSTEGFTHTRNKKRYMLTLLTGFWICQILFRIASILLPNDNVVLLNSIFGTLFLSVFTMWIYDKFFGKEKNVKLGLLALIGFILLTIAPLLLLNISDAPWFVSLILLIPSPIVVEGGINMILIALLLYIFRKNRWLQCIIIIAFSFIFYLVDPTDVQWMMVFSIIPIFLYNGKEGHKEKWFFYSFYPVHILILYTISTVFF